MSTKVKAKTTKAKTTKKQNTPVIDHKRMIIDPELRKQIKMQIIGVVDPRDVVKDKNGKIVYVDDKPLKAKMSNGVHKFIQYNNFGVPMIHKIIKTKLIRGKQSDKIPPKKHLVEMVTKTSYLKNVSPYSYKYGFMSDIELQNYKYDINASKLISQELPVERAMYQSKVDKINKQKQK